MDNICPNCKKEIDSWTAHRFNGKGEWNIHPWPCPHCGLLKSGKKPVEVKREPGGIMLAGNHRGAQITSNEKKWLEDIGSRRLLPNGDVAIVDHKGNIKEVRPQGMTMRNLR